MESKINKQLKFRIKALGIFQFIVSLMSYFGSIMYAVDNFNSFFNIFLSIILFRLFLYSNIDYILNKRLLYKNNELYLKIAFFKIKINVNKTIIIYEELFVYKRSYLPIKGLVLYIDKKKIFKLSFKNKIRLILDPTEEELIYYRKELNSHYGLDVLDFNE